jgi:hypothetical protein
MNEAELQNWKTSKDVEKKIETKKLISMGKNKYQSIHQMPAGDSIRGFLESEPGRPSSTSSWT